MSASALASAAGRAVAGGVAGVLPSNRMMLRGSIPTDAAIASFEGGHWYASRASGLVTTRRGLVTWKTF